MISFNHPIHKALYAADKAFSDRGRAIYGDDWGDARYQPEAYSDVILQHLSEAYTALSRAYNQACTEARDARSGRFPVNPIFAGFSDADLFKALLPAGTDGFVDMIRAELQARGAVWPRY